MMLLYQQNRDGRGDLMLEKSFLEVYDKFKLQFYREVFKLVRERDGSLSAMEGFSLEVIKMLDNPTVGQFADFLNISQSNATYKVNNLVAKGYVTKTVSEGDKREIRLSVCVRFYKYYGDLDHFADAAVAALESEYSPQELDTFQRMLRSLAEHVK